MKSTILTAIDIGTHSVKILMGKKDPRKKSFEILAIARSRSAGVKKGEIKRVEKIAPIIKSSIDKIEKQAGLKVKKHICNINGSHLSVVSSQGLVSVSRADQKVSKEDIDRVFKQAQTLNPPFDNKEVLDIFVKNFIIDGTENVKEPLDLYGRRLELRALLICVFSPVLEHLCQAFDSAGFHFDNNNIVHSALASSKACLSFQQKELGVALVDIGAETTNIAVFEDGNLIHCHVIPLGSANITNDIAIGLRTEIETAERIKKEFGFIATKKKTKKRKKTKQKNEKIKIPEKSLVCSKKMLENIVESRVSEIFNQIQKELKKISKQELLPAGIVLTGGGSLLPGIKEYAKESLKLPCQVSIPENIPGLPQDPAFSTSLGLLLEGWSSRDGVSGVGDIDRGDGILGRIQEKIRKIVKLILP